MVVACAVRVVGATAISVTVLTVTNPSGLFGHVEQCAELQTVFTLERTPFLPAITIGVLVADSRPRFPKLETVTPEALQAHPNAQPDVIIIGGEISQGGAGQLSVG